MIHVVRRVIGSGKNELGYGVFPKYLVEDRTTVPIEDCSEIGDRRPLHVQSKAYRLFSLHPSEKDAKQEAEKMTKSDRLA